MADANPTRRTFRPRPVWLIVGLLVAEGLLWLSEQFQWFSFNRHKGWTVLIAVVVVGVAMILMLFWFIASLIFPWRFQFSIRSLLVLTVGVAIPCGWLAVELKKAREQEATVAAIMKNGHVGYDWELDNDGISSLNARPPEPTWLRNFLGDDFFDEIVSVSYEMQINYKDGPQPADTDLTTIGELNHLQELNLANTHITESGLAHIARLTQLKRLSFYFTDITDAGMVHIAGLTRLQCLSLYYTQVTDTGLAHIAGLTQLRELSLGGTQVTDEGVKKLQRALPNCRIER